MKKSKIKQLKSFVAGLPDSVEEYIEVEIKFGTEFIKKGIFQVNGEDIIPKQKYKLKTTKLRKINHFNRLKRLIESGSKNPLNEYLEWLIIHNKSMVAKYPKLYKTEANERPQTN